jgi:hypothetical protein
MDPQERKNVLAEVLIGSLTAVAFEEMVRAVRESLKSVTEMASFCSTENHGTAFGTGALALIFALTTIRFLIGNMLHLIWEPKSPEARERREQTWFWDLLVIVAQAVTLAFLGGLSGREENVSRPFDFLLVLCFVFFIDGCWTLVHWVSEKKSCEAERKLREAEEGGQGGKQKGAPHLKWLGLDVLMLAVTAGSYGIWGAAVVYSDTGLAVLLLVNLGVFMWDYKIQKDHGLI